MDDHIAFDLAFRQQWNRVTGQFAYRPTMVGKCAGIKDSATPVHIQLALPAWSSYAARVNLSGAVAVVTPQHPGSSTVVGTRVAGTPVYTLNTADPAHWCWVAVPGSEAASDEQITGSAHQVATRQGAAPSDPTIEQFNPIDGDHMLYISIITGALRGQGYQKPGPHRSMFCSRSGTIRSRVCSCVAHGWPQNCHTSPRNAWPLRSKHLGPLAHTSGAKSSACR
jgi:hypothetical protein